MTPTPDFADLTPPDELVAGWINNAPLMSCPGESLPPARIGTDWKTVLAQAARWGAQQGYQCGADDELEACCEWLGQPCPSYAKELRAARRPAPPSLKQQALSLLDPEQDGQPLSRAEADLLRRALALIPEDAQ